VGHRNSERDGRSLSGWVWSRHFGGSVTAARDIQEGNKSLKQIKWVARKFLAGPEIVEKVRPSMKKTKPKERGSGDRGEEYG